MKYPKNRPVAYWPFVERKPRFFRTVAEAEEARTLDAELADYRDYDDVVNAPIEERAPDCCRIMP